MKLVELVKQGEASGASAATRLSSARFEAKIMAGMEIGIMSV